MLFTGKDVEQLSACYRESGTGRRRQKPALIFRQGIVFCTLGRIGSLPNIPSLSSSLTSRWQLPTRVLALHDMASNDLPGPLVSSRPLMDKLKRRHDRRRRVRQTSQRLNTIVDLGNGGDVKFSLPLFYVRKPRQPLSPLPATEKDFITKILYHHSPPTSLRPSKSVRKRCPQLCLHSRCRHAANTENRCS